MRALIRTVLFVGLTLAGVNGMRLAAQGNPEAAKLQNPVAPSAQSTADGKASYLRFCANCHGADGKGGPGNDLTPPAPDLTVKDLKHGSSDGEMFDTIKNGVGPEFNMAAWGPQGFRDQDIWNVVNYLRTLGKK